MKSDQLMCAAGGAILAASLSSWIFGAAIPNWAHAVIASAAGIATAVAMKALKNQMREDR